MSQETPLDTPPTASPDTPHLRADFSTLAISLTAVAYFVGLGIHFRDGEYDAGGRFFSAPIFAVGLGLLAVLTGLLLHGRLRSRQTSVDLPLAVLMLGLVLQLAMMLRAPASGWNDWSNDLRVGGVALRWYYGGLTAVAALALVQLIARRTLWPFPFAAILAVHAGLGVWMIRSSPEPDIDVWHFQQIGGRALLSGDTPYRWTEPDGLPRYPNIYAAREDKSMPVYGQKQAGDEPTAGALFGEKHWLRTGFPYTPLSLYVSTAGYAAAGDHRYAQAACLTAAGLLLVLARPGAWSATAALLLLFTPRAFFILGRAWSEPIVVFFLALTVFAACRLPRLLPIALGLFLASKQYLVFAVPLAWLLLDNPRDVRRGLWLVGGALATAAVVTLPLALWDIRAFWESAFVTQLDAPFRRDALSWLAWRYDVFGKQTESWPAFAVAVPMLVAALRWAPRGPAGYCLGLVAVYLPFISFNKQAFANYYLFVIAAAVCGIAVLPINLRLRATPATAASAS
jgi:hypothetical protein